MVKEFSASFAFRFVGIALLLFVAACGSQQTSSVDAVGNGKYGALVQKMELSGTLPVIVGLAGEWRFDGTLSADEQQKQREQIAVKQTQLLSEMQNLKTEKILKFQSIPFIAMTVDMDGLVYLATSPLVSSIEEDVLVNAQK